ncbi:MAG: flavodoxin domain-containing protein [Candidatus Methanoperedens sp.]|nr:flavodoxin domain-containing protein [Candidatus Methanoperedens sp.]
MVKVAIIYDTATHNTEMMANAEAFGVSSESEEAKLPHVHEATIEDIRDVDGLVLGSGTYHHEMMPTLEVFIEQAKGVNLEGKVGAAFGSYGWSAEVVELITNKLKGYGMETIEGLLIKEKPDEAGLEKYRQFGKEIAQKVKSR